MSPPLELLDERECSMIRESIHIHLEGAVGTKKESLRQLIERVKDKNIGVIRPALRYPGYVDETVVLG